MCTVLLPPAANPIEVKNNEIYKYISTNINGVTFQKNIAILTHRHEKLKHCMSIYGAFIYLSMFISATNYPAL
jgi:hypothetical protein